ncbi:MAG: sulfite exporter TauE/SafE family protein, partial [Pseudomonadota bacterium]|nr:sulfite exporter TauE/SafE family protein [Pseudomonadota bacterium]
SRFIVPERLFPILSLVSALLILGMGLVLLVQRGKAAGRALRLGNSPVPSFTPVRTAALGPGSGLMFVNRPVDATLHSHGGGPMHSHLPPESITWRSLLTLGISGGLVPCPSALVLLLAAIAVNKTGYGMLLVAVFSLGLAVTLTLVGLAFLYARNRFRKPESTARWPHLLPVLSAATITVVGAVLCLSALRTFG